MIRSDLEKIQEQVAKGEAANVFSLSALKRSQETKPLRSATTAA